MSGKALLLNDLQRSQPWEEALGMALGSEFVMVCTMLVLI